MRTITKKLTEICRPKQWKTIPGKDLLTEGYPVFGANGIIGYWSEYNHVSETITIACRGTCGAVRIADAKSYINGNAMCLDDLSNSVLLKYLYYYLRWYDFSDIITGTSIPQITIEGLRKVIVPIPPISDQQAIISILEKADTVIQGRTKELDILDELIKARFVEMFGDLADPACKWEKCQLVDVCVNSDDIKCGPFGTQLGKDEYTKEGVAVWEIPQINSEFKTFPTHFVTESKAKELVTYSIIPGDIAMSRKGNVGRCAVFPKSFKNGIIHSDVLRIRLDKAKALPEFMMRQLHYSGDIQHQIELVSSGAIMAGINVTKLKQIFVYLPPIDLQGEFVSFVAQIDKSKVVIQKALDKMQVLFDSMMQQYFG